MTDKPSKKNVDAFQYFFKKYTRFTRLSEINIISEIVNLNFSEIAMLYELNNSMFKDYIDHTALKMFAKYRDNINFNVQIQKNTLSVFEMTILIDNFDKNDVDDIEELYSEFGAENYPAYQYKKIVVKDENIDDMFIVHSGLVEDYNSNDGTLELIFY